MRTKKKILVLLFVLSIISMPVHYFFGQMAHASSDPAKAGDPAKKAAVVSQNSMEKFKAEFAYEMAQLTAKIVSAPNNNVIRFKVMLESEIDQTIAKVTPTLPDGLKNDFGIEMNQIKNKIYGNPKLIIEKAKADFSYEIAQLTTNFMTKVERSALPATQPSTQQTGKTVTQPAGSAAYATANSPAGGNGEGATVQPAGKVAAQPAAKAANAAANAPVGAASPPPASRPNTPTLRIGGTEQQVTNDANQKTASGAKPLTPETYKRLLDDLENLGSQKNSQNVKVKIDGNIRYHYSFNSGSPDFRDDASGLRTRIGVEARINQDWRINGFIENKADILNYDNATTFRLSATGKVGASVLQAGSFGYFMAEGNIYDSTFSGGRIYFGKPVQYIFSYGNTDFTKQTFVATARYDSLDYNMEASFYNYRLNNDPDDKNSIVTLGGNYKFSNFSIGSMILVASKKDSQGNNFGYVHSFNYGDLKSWRPGTYNIFVKYYNQPQYTFIAPTMNGRGGLMQGFRGYGIGVHYTLAKNLVGGLEYYNLREITTGNMAQTFWLEMVYYF